ncbi:hypothetical protein SSE37_22624 [Sagittula stellata E-37]|uniref:Uncharacterized protein n=2 Tax=Sagittula stellata TaxID=52603 RepID=A3JZX0_SAGS3|nr:hypothetical protein SSE37_22624 [Sagittula stellata E-37]
MRQDWRMRRAYLSLPVALLVAQTACTQFPELDAVATPGVENAPYPQLVPIDGLIAEPAPPRATKEDIAQVQARVGGLQSRAARVGNAQVSQSGSVADRLKRLQQKAAELRQQ